MSSTSFLMMWSLCKLCLVSWVGTSLRIYMELHWFRLVARHGLVLSLRDVGRDPPPASRTYFFVLALSSIPINLISRDVKSLCYLRLESFEFRSPCCSSSTSCSKGGV